MSRRHGWGTVTLVLFHDGRVEALLEREIDHATVARLLGGEDRGTPGRVDYLAGQLGDRRQLERALARASERLGERLLAPLARLLERERAAGIVLVPCGGWRCCRCTPSPTTARAACSTTSS
jgi:hypothetical protein